MKEIKIHMTLKDLRNLLDQQKEKTANSICSMAHQIHEGGPTNTDLIRQEAPKSRYPDDYYTLEKYLENG